LTALDGGVWLKPSTTQAECEGYMGCWEPLPDVMYRPPLAYITSFGWSPKTFGDCTSSYMPYPGAWKNFFTWKAAKWMQPFARPLQWKTNAVIPKYIAAWDSPADRYNPDYWFDYGFVNNLLPGTYLAFLF
jgi:hypothetical protein